MLTRSLKIVMIWCYSWSLAIIFSLI